MGVGQLRKLKSYLKDYFAWSSSSSLLGSLETSSCEHLKFTRQCSLLQILGLLDACWVGRSFAHRCLCLRLFAASEIQCDLHDAHVIDYLD